MAYFISLSHQSVCVCVSPRTVTTQRFGEEVSAATMTRNEAKLLDASFSMGYMYIKGETVGSNIPISLQGNGSVNMFPRQR
jgi:hypothetical protein